METNNVATLHYERVGNLTWRLSFNGRTASKTLQISTEPNQIGFFNPPGNIVHKITYTTGNNTVIPFYHLESGQQELLPWT